MGEDRSRIRSKPGVFARMRGFAFNILMANPSETLQVDDMLKVAVSDIASPDAFDKRLISVVPLLDVSNSFRWSVSGNPPPCRWQLRGCSGRPLRRRRNARCKRRFMPL